LRLREGQVDVDHAGKQREEVDRTHEEDLTLGVLHEEFEGFPLRLCFCLSGVLLLQQATLLLIFQLLELVGYVAHRASYSGNSIN